MKKPHTDIAIDRRRPVTRAFHLLNKSEMHYVPQLQGSFYTISASDMQQLRAILGPGVDASTGRPDAARRHPRKRGSK